MNKKILLIIIIFLFCFSLSYNLYKWEYYRDINEITTSLNKDFDILKNITSDSEQLKLIEKIEKTVLFQQKLLFGGTDNVNFYE